MSDRARSAARRWLTGQLAACNLLDVTRPVDVDLINLLVARDGVLTTVVLSDGRTLAVMNVAWGYDDGDVHAHVTTNVSPSVLDVESDFFFTHEVASLIDPITGRSLLDVRYA